MVQDHNLGTKSHRSNPRLAKSCENLHLKILTEKVKDSVTWVVVTPFVIFLPGTTVSVAMFVICTVYTNIHGNVSREVTFMHRKKKFCIFGTDETIMHSLVLITGYIALIYCSCSSVVTASWSHCAVALRVPCSYLESSYRVPLKLLLQLWDLRSWS